MGAIAEQPCVTGDPIGGCSDQYEGINDIVGSSSTANQRRRDHCGRRVHLGHGTDDGQSLGATGGSRFVMLGGRPVEAGERDLGVGLADVILELDRHETVHLDDLGDDVPRLNRHAATRDRS